MRTNLPSFDEIKEDTHIVMKQIIVNDLPSIRVKTNVEKTDALGKWIAVETDVYMLTDPIYSQYSPHKVYFDNKGDLMLFYYYNKVNPHRHFPKGGTVYIFKLWLDPYAQYRYDGRVNVFIDQQKNPENGGYYSIFIFGENGGSELLNIER